MSGTTARSRRKSAADSVHDDSSTPGSRHDELREMIRDHAEKQGTLERELSDQGGRLSILESQNQTIIEGQRLLFGKVDNISTALTGVKAGHGRISGITILTALGVFAPIVGAAAYLGHYFVTLALDASTAATGALEDRVAKIEVVVPDTWKSEDHHRYHAEVFQPIQSQVIANAIMAARIEERLAAQSRHDSGTPLETVARALTENTEILSRMLLEQEKQK